MSVNCMKCGVAKRTGIDLLCDACRATTDTPTPSTPAEALATRITDYLSSGGLFNPELANHDAVRDLLIQCRAQLSASTAREARLREVVEAARQLSLRIKHLKGKLIMTVNGIEEDLDAALANFDALSSPSTASGEAAYRLNPILGEPGPATVGEFPTPEPVAAGGEVEKPTIDKVWKTSAETSAVAWPINTMDGAPWNILDATGARIAICGFDVDTKTDEFRKTSSRIAWAIVGMARNLKCENDLLKEEVSRLEHLAAEAKKSSDQAWETAKNYGDNRDKLCKEIDRLKQATPQPPGDRVREALEIRERQLRNAVAGMEQGKPPFVFVVLDEAGRIADVVTKQRNGSDDQTPIRELVPLPAAGDRLREINLLKNILVLIDSKVQGESVDYRHGLYAARAIVTGAIKDLETRKVTPMAEREISEAELDAMKLPTYLCTHCGWTGSEPRDHEHGPSCPKCPCTAMTIPPSPDVLRLIAELLTLREIARRGQETIENLNALAAASLAAREGGEA